MIVAGLLRHLLGDQPARGLEVEHENLRLQQRRLDVLALLRRLALEQRRHDAERAEQSRRQIGDRNADAHRALAGQAGDRHQPAHALRDLVEARPVLVGPVLAEARDAAVDDARIDLLQVLVVDAEPALHVGAEVLDHDVGLLHHLEERGAAFLGLQVERHAPLVAVQVLEVGALARTAGGVAALLVRRHLDLDDVGAPVRELAHAGGAGADTGQVEDREARKGLGCFGNSHRKGHRQGYRSARHSPIKPGLVYGSSATSRRLPGRWIGPLESA